MKEAMDRKVTKEEIEESFLELNKNKTPGPDGIKTNFTNTLKKTSLQSSWKF